MASIQGTSRGAKAASSASGCAECHRWGAFFVSCQLLHYRGGFLLPFIPIVKIRSSGPAKVCRCRAGYGRFRKLDFEAGWRPRRCARLGALVCVCTRVCVCLLRQSDRLVYATASQRSGVTVAFAVS